MNWIRPNSTPDRLRLVALVTVVVLLVVGSVSWLLTDRLVNETAEAAQSTGEVLIATQQVSASFAEADAAAVSVHLAGADGNRAQQRLFEQALDRASASLERVARLVGDDERSHEALQTIAARSTQYSRLIETARVSSVEDLAGADALLSEASAINRTEISPEVQVIATRASGRFDSQTSSTWYLIALSLFVLALFVLLGAQVVLNRQFRRLLNIPLVLATLAVIVLLVFGTRGFLGQQQAFSDAQTQALDAIETSEEIQQTAYRHRSLSTTAVLAGRAPDDLQALESALEQDGGLLDAVVARSSSNREVATANEVRARWERYVEANQQSLDALTDGETATAERLTQGDANSAFNGFNTTIEALLLDNREQFLSQLQSAASSLRWLRGLILVGSLLAAVLAWSGLAQRIGEYR